MALVLSKDGEQVVYKTKRLEEGVTCDICSTFIQATDKWSSKDTTKYFEVTTGHHDWGNDSCESIKYYDICPDCINKFVADYIKNASGTVYIEIETAWDDD